MINMIATTLVRKSNIVYLNFWDSSYISIGKLHLMSIDFKVKSNMVSKHIAHLGKSLILVGLPVLVGISGGECYKVPRCLLQFYFAHFLQSLHAKVIV